MDILIYTEVDARETDAACLIKYEMEKRGYSVAIERYNRICDSGNMLLYRPKVLVLPWLYDVDFLYNFINSNSKGKLCIVNLQSEQILSKNFIANNYHMPKDICKQYIHLAWGNKTAERFYQNGIEEQNIWQIGNINMDFNSEKLLQVYKAKQEIADRFGLAQEKKWCLFISSFTHPSMTREERENYIERFPFLKDFIDISTNSQKILISWFEKYVQTHESIEFIYRPHPVELKNELLLEFSKKYSNFHVISELSVRQWIYVCEKNTTWFSTSIVDVYYQNKDCGILRPIGIPVDADCELFYSCNAIDNYDDFENFLESDKKEEFPISDDIIEAYYGKNECGDNYLIFCDELESLMKKGIRTAPISLNCGVASLFRRNLISFIFQLNKVVNISNNKFFRDKSNIKNQLEEKWNSRIAYRNYKNELQNKLKELI